MGKRAIHRITPENVDTLYHLVLDVVTEPKVKDKVLVTMNMMDDAAESEEEKFMTLVGILQDGIKHGNWPAASELVSSKKGKRK